MLKSILILSVTFQTIIISFFAFIYAICGAETIETIINAVDSSLFVFSITIAPLLMAVLFAIFESLSDAICRRFFD
tara:strand:+ start:680 stop:907 length:228 start_codon:yes stop_codon:yes gene_type:complete